MRIPYLFQFSMSMEHQLSRKSSLAVTYTGNAGIGTFRSRDINAPLPPFYAQRPNENYSVIRQIESSGRSEVSRWNLRYAATRRASFRASCSTR